MSFWPDTLTEEELRAPAELLHDAAEELEERISKVKVQLPIAELDDRLVIGFEVRHRSSGATLRLFEVTHRKVEAYPALISPPADNIPDFLARKRYVPGTLGLGSAYLSHSAVMKVLTGGTPGEVVENPWVCGTPGEFRKKLRELLAMDIVTARLIALISTKPAQSTSSDE